VEAAIVPFAEDGTLLLSYDVEEITDLSDGTTALARAHGDLTSVRVQIPARVERHARATVQLRAGESLALLGAGRSRQVRLIVLSPFIG
jgi:hypothetical protein